MDRKEIFEFPGYWIYEDGRVWSDSKLPANSCGKFLMQSLDKDGYVRYKLYVDGTYCRKFAHRLVLEAFVGPCPEGMECRHLDGNPQNNHVSNLCWGTKEENQADKRRHGTHFHPIGEKNGSSKLSRQEVVEILDLVRHGLCSQTASVEDGRGSGFTET
jgi:hypothetical protein